eukprot:2463819-Amphidinium_carterae.1
MLYDMSKREGWETSVGFPFLGAVLVGLVIVALATSPPHNLQTPKPEEAREHRSFNKTEHKKS